MKVTCGNIQALDTLASPGYIDAGMQCKGRLSVLVVMAMIAFGDGWSCWKFGRFEALLFAGQDLTSHINVSP